MLKERRKSVIEKGSLALSLFPSSQVRDETRKGEIERDRKRTRIGERKESERANGRTSGRAEARGVAVAVAAAALPPHH